MVMEDIYHLVTGLVWLIVVVVAILFYIADGDALRRRREDSKPEQSKPSNAEDAERSLRPR
jgi:hypothetical protein